MDWFSSLLRIAWPWFRKGLKGKTPPLLEEVVILVVKKKAKKDDDDEGLWSDDEGLDWDFEEPEEDIDFDPDE